MINYTSIKGIQATVPYTYYTSFDYYTNGSILVKTISRHIYIYIYMEREMVFLMTALSDG